MQEKTINPVLKQVLEFGPTVFYLGLYTWIKDETYTISDGILRFYCRDVGVCPGAFGLNGRTLDPDWRDQSDAGLYRVYGDLFRWADVVF